MSNLLTLCTRTFSLVLSPPVWPPRKHMIHKKRLSITVAASVLVELLSKVMPIIIVHYAQRNLGLTAFGFAQFGIAAFELFLPFVYCGYNNFGSVEMGRIRNDPGKIRELISNVMALKLAHAVILLAMILTMAWTIPGYQAYVPMILALSFVLIFTATEMLWVQVGLQEYALVSLFSGAGKIASLGLVLLMVHQPDDAILYCVATFFSNLVVNLSTMVFCLRRYPLVLPRWQDMKTIIRRSSPFTIIAIFLIFMDRYDIFVVERMFGLKGAGLYSGAARLNHALFQILNAVVFSFFSEMILAGDAPSLTKHFSLSTWTLLAFLSPILFGIWFVDRDILALVLSSEFTSVRTVLSLLVLGTLPGVLIAMFGLQILQVRHQSGSMAVALIGGGATMMVLSYVLGQPFGLIGVAISVVLGKTVAALMMMYSARHFLDRFPLREATRTLGAGAIMALVLWWLAPSTFIATVLLGAVTYTLALVALNWRDLNRIWVILRSRL